MIQHAYIEVRWFGDRRRKLWIAADDFRDPVLVVSLHGNGWLARRELEFINIEDPAIAASRDLEKTA